MLYPKKVKFRKPHRGNLSGVVTSENGVVFGQFGLQSLEPVWLTSRQIEATRRTISRYVKKTGKLWIRVFPDKSISSKPPETRMGSGKGSPEYWAAIVKPGQVLFEISGVSQVLAYEALKNASYKLPVKTKFISKN